MGGQGEQQGHSLFDSHAKNYLEGVILTKVQLHSQGMWDVVEDGLGEHREYRRAMSLLLWAVPVELARTLVVKKTINKEDWDTLKNIKIGIERVREVRMPTR